VRFSEIGRDHVVHRANGARHLRVSCRREFVGFRAGRRTETGASSSRSARREAWRRSCHCEEQVVQVGRRARALELVPRRSSEPCPEKHEFARCRVVQVSMVRRASRGWVEHPRQLAVCRRAACSMPSRSWVSAREGPAGRDGPSCAGRRRSSSRAAPAPTSCTRRDRGASTPRLRPRSAGTTPIHSRPPRRVVGSASAARSTSRIVLRRRVRHVLTVGRGGDPERERDTPSGSSSRRPRSRANDRPH
jgi:hypothetical protein